jgi:glycerophosphoryl diester phosphodiesterase
MKKNDLMAAIVCAAVIAAWYGDMSSAQKKKILIAHRGASGYAPEHTLAAYQLALEQQADYVEQDLQITKDGVLVCLHDETLERTTNVEEVFPTRGKDEKGQKRWYVADFTLAEIKQLDAGAWFNEKFKGTRVPTFQEAIDAVRGKAGLYPETKAPEDYAGRGLSMEKLLVDILKKNKLDKPGADKRTPVVIQSFSPTSLRKLSEEFKLKLPLVLLIGRPQDAQPWLTTAGLQAAKKFATGVGPNKALIESDPKLVERAHAAGLTVTPWTFRVGATGKYPDVKAEMRHFLYVYGVDELFTDYPDQFPKR